jgi:molybdate transport system substrate-binding protein
MTLDPRPRCDSTAAPTPLTTPSGTPTVTAWGSRRPTMVSLCSRCSRQADPTPRRFVVTGAVRRQPPATMHPRRARAALALTLVCGWLSACTHDAPRSEVVRVHAASSLTELFQRLEALFEALNPDTDAVLSFAGSQVLRLQIAQGAPADIFVSAHRDHVDALVDAGHARTPRQIAENTLAIIVPPGNPSKIHGLHDLPRAQRIVLGTPHSPVGSYARQLLARVDVEGGTDLSPRVMNHVVSLESNVRLLRAKVALREADAALVYATDTRGSDDVLGITLPPSENIRVQYYAATITTSRNLDAVSRWRAFMTSQQARTVLGEMGYGAP